MDEIQAGTGGSRPGPGRTLPLLLAGVAALVVIVVGAVLLTVPLGTTAPPSGSVVFIGSPLLGKPAPEIALTATDGRTVSLSDYRGRPVIVNFWASWCIPCREEFPQFVAARSAHAEDGLEILGVVHQDGADTASAFARDHDASWPMLMDNADAAWNAYRALGVPSTYFVDRDGIVRATSLGPVTETSLPQQLATILPAGSVSPSP
jgi:cytochrome c biogenesis protein CcmG/thiol:disulfide interchange protein DsbE